MSNESTPIKFWVTRDQNRGYSLFFGTAAPLYNKYLCWWSGLTEHDCHLAFPAMVQFVPVGIDLDAGPLGIAEVAMSFQFLPTGMKGGSRHG